MAAPPPLPDSNACCRSPALARPPLPRPPPAGMHVCPQQRWHRAWALCRPRLKPADQVGRLSSAQCLRWRHWRMPMPTSACFPPTPSSLVQRARSRGGCTACSHDPRCLSAGTSRHRTLHPAAQPGQLFLLHKSRRHRQVFRESLRGAGGPAPRALSVRAVGLRMEG